MDTVQLVNGSKSHTADCARVLPTIAKACSLQLVHLGRDWQQWAWPVKAMIAAGFAVLFVDDDTEVSGALAFHDVGTDGRPYAVVILNEILGNGGDWLHSDASVSAACSHEICEMVVDPGANRWAADDRGELWALEACDPVQSASYELLGATVSAYVTPAYFDPFGRPPFDNRGILDAPFTIDAGGYAISWSKGAVFGERVPLWRQAYTLRPGARTMARLAGRDR